MQCRNCFYFVCNLGNILLKISLHCFVTLTSQPVKQNHSIMTISVIDLVQPPDVIVGCRTDRDCPDFTACENRKCINPCAQRDPCARNAYCKVIMHQPVCTCPDGYIGDPRTSCELRKYNNNNFPLMYFLKQFKFLYTIQYRDNKGLIYHKVSGKSILIEFGCETFL